MRARTDSGEPRPGRQYRRAVSRPATNLDAIARGEPRVEELLELLDLAADPVRRIYILQEVARVYRNDLDDPAAAVVALRAALQEDQAHHDAVIDAIEEITSETDSWDELLTELMEDATSLAATDPRRAADLWVRVGLWYDDPVGHRGFATHAVRQALELVPHHLAALTALAEFLREEGYWLDLVGVLERLAAVAPDDDQRIELLLSLADVADTHLSDHQSAIAACRRALKLDGTCQPAFDTLRSLLRRTDRIEAIAELLETRSALIADADEHLDISIEIARIYGEQLGDPGRATAAWEAITDVSGAIARLGQLVDTQVTADERAVLHYRLGWFLLRGGADGKRAEWHLSQALVEDPQHTPSLRLLAALYRQRGDLRKACSMLERAAVADPELHDELILESSRLRADELDDLAGAAALCEGALAAAPRSSPIRRMLAALYAGLGRWTELQPLLVDLESEIVGSADESDVVRSLYLLIARSASEMGDDDRAFAYLYEARALAPDDPEVLRGLADQYFARSSWAEAAADYRALLTAGAAPTDEAAIHYRLGVALRATGELPAALAAFQRVAELEPDHLPASEAAAELLVDLERWRPAARAKRALLELVPADDRCRLLIELADLYRDRLGDRREALALYGEAAEQEPSNHVALQRRLDTATELGDWTVALQTIDRFVAGETVAKRRGSYLHAAAVIHRDRLDDRERAAELLEHALDAFFADPTTLDAAEVTRFMKPFVDVDRLHSGQRDWTAQARSYRRMIKRLPLDHPILGDLWHALGEIYRSRLKSYAEAIAAFEVARSLAPDNVERRAILAELYQLTSDAPTSAADEYHALLAMDPGRADSYRALKEIYAAAGHMDQAWCACRVLVFLDRATADEAELYRRYRSTSLAVVRSRLAPALQGRLASSDEAGAVATVLGLVRAAVAAARPSELSLRGSRPVDPREDLRPRVRMLAHMATALDQTLPLVLDQSQRKGVLDFGLCTVDGALRPVLAFRAGLLELSDRSAAFTIGRALALLAPGRVLATMFDRDELRAIMRWIIGIQPDGRPGELRRLLERVAAPRLRPDHREQLEQARPELARADWAAELDRWRRATVITSDRTGFLLSGDLTESARLIAAADPAGAAVEPAERILELLRYSVTDDHAIIRRQLCGRV